MRKKMIEVAIPLDAINRESAREKSIRHGHPSTLHLWWARRPLAACRAVLFASLVDDPESDPANYGPDGAVDPVKAQARRDELFGLISELVKWTSSHDESVLARARAEIAASIASAKVHDSKEWTPKTNVCTEQAERFVTRTAKPDNVRAFLYEHAPPVLDPFCGGGSIPFEAQRLGLRAYASDLNPVPVLINKALIEAPALFEGCPPVNPESRSEAVSKKKGRTKQKTFEPRAWKGASGLAEDVRHYGMWMYEEAKKEAGHLYPTVRITDEMIHERPDLEQYSGQDLTVIAWLWARTVVSPNPAVRGVRVPLISTYYVCQKAGKEAWIEPRINAAKNAYEFRVRSGKPPSDIRDKVSAGTKTGRGQFQCLLSGQPIDPAQVKEEGREGRLGRAMTAVIAGGSRQRVYLSPIPSLEVAAERTDFLEALPCPEISGYFNPPIYGYRTFGSLFTDRQKASLEAFARLVPKAYEQCRADGGTEEYSRAVALYLALAVDRLSNRLTSFCIWDTGRENIAQTFSEQGVPMSWDYVEANPFSGATGSWEKALEYIPACIEESCSGKAVVYQHDAALPREGLPCAPLISTDPPYYSSIAYADFADFFYGTLRSALRELFPDLLSTIATPKQAETVAAWHRHGGDRAAAAADFTAKLMRAIKQIADTASNEYPLTIYYAFKQQEFNDSSDALITAWESILDVIVLGGLQVLSTWPMRTEQTSGRKADKNTLASSIVIVCRRRSADALQATRKHFLAELKAELPHALRAMQLGHVAPVDLAQAAIGPGMAVFSRFSRVVESDGTPMAVRTALMLINQSLDEVFAEQEGEFDGDTRWAVAWFEQFGMEEGDFGEAETLSKAKNTSVNGLVEAGLVVARARKVRLVKRAELPASWNPASDKRLTIWEVTQHLIHRLDQQGEGEAAKLVRQLRGVADAARDLAYRLYTLCERKKWAQDALAYNSLVVAWPELTKIARSSKRVESEEQTTLF